MNHAHEALYALADDLRVRVRTDHGPLIEHLDEFYTRSLEGPVNWTVQAELTAPTPAMRVNPWGAGHQADPTERLLRRATTDPDSLLAGTRIAMREMLVDRWERRHYTMLHASAVTKGDTLVLIVGEERAGKTTLMLDAVLEHGWTFVANDHLVIHRDDQDLVVTEIPDVISVRTSTFRNMRESLPTPYDPNGVDVDTLRSLPLERPWGEEALMYYSPRSLGQPPRTEVRCGPGTHRRVIIVSASFTSESGARPPEDVADGTCLLTPHVRRDWFADPQRNVHELPRSERSLGEFSHDSERILRELARHAQAWHWEHDGDIAPLIDQVTSR